MADLKRPIVERARAATYRFDWSKVADDEPIPAAPLLREAADTIDKMLDALKAVSSDIHKHQGTISLGTLALVSAAIAKAEGGNNAG